MSPLTGKSLHQGKYTFEQELGRGGFGVTYKAINNALNQVVVIKALNESLRQDPNFLNHQRQFQDEARRLAKCTHPNIVRVTDFFTEDGLPYIVMDYVPGQTLDTIVLPNNPLPEAIALQYIQQVGNAIKVIHQNGLLHRDIKPQNLILHRDTQTVVLIDFGIAREFTPGLTQAHTHLVSEGYAPIEQYLPQAKRSPATDVYGLSATLYTLLTARVPIAATLRDRCPLAPPREVRPQLSAGISEAVMRGMAMEPHHRPASVDEWLALLPHAQGYGSYGGRAAGSTTQVATVAVAPAHHQRRRAAPPAHIPGNVPTQLSRSGGRSPRWLLGLFVGAVALPFLVGYGLWQLVSSPQAESTPAETSPSPVNSTVDEPESSPVEVAEPVPEAIDPPTEEVSAPPVEPDPNATPVDESAPTPDESDVPPDKIEKQPKQEEAQEDAEPVQEAEPPVAEPPQDAAPPEVESLEQTQGSEKGAPLE